MKTPTLPNQNRLNRPGARETFPQPNPPTTRRLQFPTPMNALRILHVDDEEALTHIFRIILEGTGRFIVREERSATHALEAAHEFRPDLILLDKGLEEMSGEELAAELGHDCDLRGVPIAFVTGDTTREEAAAEPTPTLPKPVSPAELLGFVDALLDFNTACAGV